MLRPRGCRVISRAQLEAAKNLLIVADVNAIPPSGVEGLDMMATGSEVNSPRALGVGPLAIGNIKYKTEFGLFKKMIEAAKPVCLDFRDAFALARELDGDREKPVLIAAASGRALAAGARRAGYVRLSPMVSVTRIRLPTPAAMSGSISRAR